MPLNASGAISLGGATAGQSVALELTLGATTQISLDDAGVRTLSGVASGAITIPTNFHGKSFITNPTVGVFYAGQPNVTTWGNTASRINACGTIIGTETAIGTGRYRAGGAGMPTNAMFWGGAVSNAGTGTNTAVRINACGALVGTQTTPTTVNSGATSASIASGKLGSNGVYYAPQQAGSGGYCVISNVSVRLNACVGLVSQNTSITALLRQGVAGAVAGTNLVVYGGQYSTCCCGTPRVSYITRINACGTKVGACSSPAITLATYQGGAPVGGNAMFFGFVTGGGRVTRINTCGAVVGSQTTITPNRQSAGGAAIGTNGVYYGGCLSTTVTRINACGAVVGGATTVGTARSGQAGAGI